MSHSLFDDGFGHHHCCCFCLVWFGSLWFVAPVSRWTESQPICMLDCICILLKISHLFSFRHVSTVFGLTSLFFSRLVLDYTISSFLSHRLFFSTFHSHHSLIVVLVTYRFSYIFFYQEFSIIYSDGHSALLFLLLFTKQNQRWFRYDSRGSLHLLFLFWVIHYPEWTSIELVCGAQLSAHLKLLFKYYVLFNTFIYVDDCH